MNEIICNKSEEIFNLNIDNEKLKLKHEERDKDLQIVTEEYKKIIEELNKIIKDKNIDIMNLEKSIEN